MANLSVAAGYENVAPQVHTLEATSHPAATSDQLFTVLALAGALAGVAASTAVEIVNPAVTGLFCTVFGSVAATLSWYLGHSLMTVIRPHRSI